VKVVTIPTGQFGANCHIAADDDGHALVIDPGDEADKLLDILRRRRWTVAAYLITHGHMDHLSALADMEREHPAPVAMHPADAQWAFGAGNRMLPWYDTPAPPENLSRHLADNQEWTDFGLHYRVLATPGHSPGSVCFYFPEEKALFTGDTLFAGSVGRTDFPGGDDRLLGESLAKLARLPADTVVLAGHGPQTTIGQEKQTNPFLRGQR
jgi:glyoxylase-like metal-dependent hydrolase (beta-lactamase superfamily II)